MTIRQTLFRKLHRGLQIGNARLFNFAWHTEHAGPGRIAALRFLGGAGYVWRPHSKIRGFTVSLRLRRGHKNKYRVQKAPPLFWVSRNPNKYAPH